MNNTYFKVKDFNKTEQKHYKRIIKLEELEIAYDDVLDSGAWEAVETEVWKKLDLWKQMDIEVKARSVATLINSQTREVIQNSLEFLEVPKSYDTAFYIAHYCKINEGMTDILQNFIDRGEVKE